MHDRPDSSELLEIARQTLLRELLPALPPEQHYAVRMVANAMAVARREFEHGASARRAEVAVYRELYGSTDTAASEAGAAKGRARLAQDLRSGRFDDRLIEVLDCLLEQTQARLRVSNPKYLAAAGLV